MLILFAALLSLAVTAGLLFALLRAPTDADGSAATIYDDQLAEVARDQDRGLLGPEEAKQARIEVERRLLDAARRESNASHSPNRRARFALAMTVGLIPVGAAGLYQAVGNPRLADTAFAERTRLDRDVASLRDAVAADPSRVEPWVALAEALSAEGRYADAAPAYAEAVRLTGGRDRRLAGAYAETLALEAGRVTAEAEEIFAAIKAQHPDDARATYYIALAKVARGDRAAAVADLEALLGPADPSAPWYPGLARLLTELTSGTGAPPAPTDGAIPGPTESQVEAAEALTDDERAAMIRDMVEGLDARLRDAPDDIDGWRRLARAYDVLGDEARAAEAWREVLARAPDDPEAQAALAAAAP